MRRRTDLRPYRESTLLAGFRFALELADWIFIYAAWGLFPFVLAIVALSVLSVPGDKHLVLVAVPGRVRLALEAAVAIAGIAAAYGLSATAGALLALGHLALAFLALPRWRWLWQN